ncbi:hypothetical protein BT96DRAFT_936152 [Gymnopus androsaceus JB14]|uniref:Uncharacterized protein n=1 Tax=Gymnopus androsaceus JB14 TaxID=1447944 RepID=A0A6A4HWM2_9AGAR|nr:hypothetical protein BT96DRAFT_936152 [Gymnopus androsaceus JB14]
MSNPKSPNHIPSSDDQISALEAALATARQRKEEQQLAKEEAECEEWLAKEEAEAKENAREEERKRRHWLAKETAKNALAEIRVAKEKIVEQERRRQATAAPVKPGRQELPDKVQRMSKVKCSHSDGMKTVPRKKTQRTRPEGSVTGLSADFEEAVLDRLDRIEARFYWLVCLLVKGKGKGKAKEESEDEEEDNNNDDEEEQ